MPYKHEVVGSSPTAPTKRFKGGEVAQLVEQWTENPRVDGSIPSLATSFFLNSVLEIQLD